MKPAALLSDIMLAAILDAIDNTGSKLAASRQLGIKTGVIYRSLRKGFSDGRKFEIVRNGHMRYKVIYPDRGGRNRMRMWSKFRSNRTEQYIQARATVSAEQRGEAAPIICLTFRETIHGQRLPIIMTKAEATSLLNALQTNLDTAQRWEQEHEATRETT
jgi:hypothetical protein